MIDISISFLKLFIHALCLIAVLFSTSPGQEELNIDSLVEVYSARSYDPSERLDVLKYLTMYHPDPDKALQYSDELIYHATQKDSISHLYYAYVNKGNALRIKGDLSEALESYIRAAKFALEKKDNGSLGIVYITIADVYSIMGNHEKAINQYQEAIDILKKQNDSVSVASALLNAGDEYFNQGELDSAMHYFEESGQIFRDINYLVGTAYNLGNIGMVYAEQGKDNLATLNIDTAINILEQEEDYYPICVYLTYMSDIYLKQNDWDKALQYTKRSLELAQKYGLKNEISDAHLQLSELHKKAGNLQQYIDNYKAHITYKDSVKNVTAVQQVESVRADFEISLKQMEVDLLHQKQKNQRIIVWSTIIALFLVGMLAFGLYRRYLYINRTKKIIEKEKKHSDELLHNILPVEIAHELKIFGKVKANKFDSVTVLFTDFKGFTKYAESLSPEQLVESVDYYFSKFDEILGRFHLEKIKTIGDAYMCAGGLPFPSIDHANRMVQAALEIVEFVNKAKQDADDHHTHFDIRVGINTGPVVAGVVGTKKFAYDIWGDTVNIAARMETNSEPGRVNISENTYKLIKDDFDVEYRGEIVAKNRGSLKMYFVNGLKSLDLAPES